MMKIKKLLRVSAPLFLLLYAVQCFAKNKQTKKSPPVQHASISVPRPQVQGKSYLSGHTQGYAETPQQKVLKDQGKALGFSELIKKAGGKPSSVRTKQPDIATKKPLQQVIVSTSNNSGAATPKKFQSSAPTPSQAQSTTTVQLGSSRAAKISGGMKLEPQKVNLKKPQPQQALEGQMINKPQRGIVIDQGQAPRSAVLIDQGKAPQRAIVGELEPQKVNLKKPKIGVSGMGVSKKVEKLTVSREEIAKAQPQTVKNVGPQVSQTEKAMAAQAGKNRAVAISEPKTTPGLTADQKTADKKRKRNVAIGAAVVGGAAAIGLIGGLVGGLVQKDTNQQNQPAVPVPMPGPVVAPSVTQTDTTITQVTHLIAPSAPAPVVAPMIVPVVFDEEQEPAPEEEDLTPTEEAAMPVAEEQPTEEAPLDEEKPTTIVPDVKPTVEEKPTTIILDDMPQEEPTPQVKAAEQTPVTEEESVIEIKESVTEVKEPVTEMKEEVAPEVVAVPAPHKKAPKQKSPRRKKQVDAKRKRGEHEEKEKVEKKSKGPKRKKLGKPQEQEPRAKRGERAEGVRGKNPIIGSQEKKRRVRND